MINLLNIFHFIPNINSTLLFSFIKRTFSKKKFKFGREAFPETLFMISETQEPLRIPSSAIPPPLFAQLHFCLCGFAIFNLETSHTLDVVDTGSVQEQHMYLLFSPKLQAFTTKLKFFSFFGIVSHTRDYSPIRYGYREEYPQPLNKRYRKLITTRPLDLVASCTQK